MSEREHKITKLVFVWVVDVWGSPRRPRSRQGRLERSVFLNVMHSIPFDLIRFYSCELCDHAMLAWPGEALRERERVCAHDVRGLTFLLLLRWRKEEKKNSKFVLGVSICWSSRVSIPVPLPC